MVNQHGLFSVPDEHECDHTASSSSQAHQDVQNRYQRDAQGLSPTYDCDNDPWNAVESSPGGTAQVYEGVVDTYNYQAGQSNQPRFFGSTTASGYQRDNYVQDVFEQHVEATNDDTWDQNRIVGGSSWPYDLQRHEDYVSGRQPATPQASRPMEDFGFSELENTFYCVDTQMAIRLPRSSQYVQATLNPVPDDDMMPEESINLDEDLPKSQNACGDIPASKPYGFQSIHGCDQPWTPLAALSHTKEPCPYTDVHRWSGNREVLSVEDQTDTSWDAASSYVVVGSPSSSLSMHTTDDMADSAATLRQPVSEPVINKDLVVYTDLHGEGSMMAQQEVPDSRPVLDLTYLHTL